MNGQLVIVGLGGQSSRGINGKAGLGIVTSDLHNQETAGNVDNNMISRRHEKIKMTGSIPRFHSYRQIINM